MATRIQEGGADYYVNVQGDESDDVLRGLDLYRNFPAVKSQNEDTSSQVERIVADEHDAA